MIPARLRFARMRSRRRAFSRNARPTAAWKAAALTWRKMPRTFAPVVHSSDRFTVRQHWRPHADVHLNVVVNAGAAAPHRGPLPARPASSILWRKFETRTTTHLPILRDFTTRERRTRADHIEREVVTTLRRRSEASRHEIFRHFLINRPQLRPLGDGRRMAAEQTLPRLRRAPPPPEMARRLQRATSAPIPVEAAIVKSLLSNLPPVIQHRRAAGASIRPSRAPDMVWRKETEAQSAGTPEQWARAVAASVPATSAPAAPISWPAPEAVEALRPRLLDSALIDRVAENVIGRVEKRIRIERERRGM